ncbi:hypothetical protein AVEN_248084-1 [Araneus ventricosus]|uniref:Uncharacterized protein n=1 Tax=Araneus ventricosus TaxID=182803 RepID=A0A4Y2MRR6_ARAVE|nr:hypothetical protein AVEN_248084-1 [Araneus ventricosus]
MILGHLLRVSWVKGPRSQPSIPPATSRPTKMPKVGISASSDNMSESRFSKPDELQAPVSTYYCERLC